MKLVLTFERLTITKEHISLIKAGNKVAFDQLFLTYYQFLCNYAYQFLHEKEGAEEVVQDMFFHLWEKRESLDIKSSIKSYVFQAVRNRCLTLLKHLAVREEYKKHNKNTIEYQEQQTYDFENELATMIEVAVNELPEERQKVFRLNRYEGLKYQEIADHLGISVKTVEGQMSKALKFLRQELKDYLPLLLFILYLLKNN